MHIGAFLKANARRFGPKPALIYGEESLSFAAFDEQSDRLANALQARGVGPGVRVMFYAGNSLAIAVAAAAVWKAGAIVVPASRWLVVPELRFMITDSAPSAIMFGSEQAAAVAEIAAGTRLIRIAVDGAAETGVLSTGALIAEGAASPPPELPADLEDAMIAYTSGTTGRPKGAVTTHANLYTTVVIGATYWGLRSDDVHLLTTPIAHRTGLSRLMTGIVLGVTVVIMNRFEPAVAATLIARHGITVIGLVPTVARVLLDHLERSPERLDSLRLMLATGEAFPVELKARLFARLPRIGLVSFFALTEGGVPAALLPDEQRAKPDSVGRPTPGIDIRLVGADGHEAAGGASGEILVRDGLPGRGHVIRGYLNRPDDDAAAFDGAWFRTGDIGRFDADGYLYIVDRAKDMIVSGGLNIYSREVEDAIGSHPAVGEVAVVAGPDREFNECVVAFVAPRPGAAIDAEAVVGHCRERLASYKKPRHVFVLAALPRNANGKVLKTELRERARAALEQQAGKAGAKI